MLTLTTQASLESWSKRVLERKNQYSEIINRIKHSCYVYRLESDVEKLQELYDIIGLARINPHENIYVTLTRTEVKLVLGEYIEEWLEVENEDES